VGKRFGEVVALDDFTLGVEDGELVTVLGPSGCGKSTLLRLAAGLEALSEGSIRLAGRRIDELPAHRRNVAMVFQSYALYPHLSVRANIEFPLRMRGVPRGERRRRAEAVAEVVELTDVLERRPAALSGGQRQRVALGRALVRDPELFLLDEPLSNVDSRLRGSLREHVRGLQRRLAVTTLYVTHDQTEAMTLGERMVVLDGGRIQQVDTPARVWERPANTFVAGFLGSPPMNLLEARCAGGVLRVEDQTVALPPALRERLAHASGRVVVGVRPEAFRAARGEEGLVVLPDPSTRESLGSETLARAALGTRRLAVRLFGGVAELPDRLAAPADALHVFDAATGARIGP
jgi:ABC-type sugar transport system ATPase subunit